MLTSISYERVVRRHFGPLGPLKNPTINIIAQKAAVVSKPTRRHRFSRIETGGCRSNSLTHLLARSPSLNSLAPSFASCRSRLMLS